MRPLVTSLLLLGSVAVILDGEPAGVGTSPAALEAGLVRPVSVHPLPRAIDLDPDEVVQEYCTRCHSERRLRGNLSLEDFALAEVPEMAEVAERMIRKLRVGMMPPADADRPSRDTLLMLARAL